MVPLEAFVRSAEDVVVRETSGGVAGVSDVVARGDLERAIALPFAEGVPVLPMTGGVAVRDGGGVGRLIEGLSHEEKKSSSVSTGTLASSPPSMTTSPGYLTRLLAYEQKDSR